MRLTNTCKLPHSIDLETVQSGMVVAVEFGGDNVHNDLISCLTDNLNTFQPDGNSQHDVIVKPSEVCVFRLERAPVIPGHSKTSPDPFVFPKSFFLDRFLFHNFELTNEKRELEHSIRNDIKDLMAYKTLLTRSNVSACSPMYNRLPSLIYFCASAGPYNNDHGQS